MTATSRKRCIYCQGLTWLVSRDGTAMCYDCRDRAARPAWEAQMEQDRQDRNAATSPDCVCDERGPCAHHELHPATS